MAKSKAKPIPEGTQSAGAARDEKGKFLPGTTGNPGGMSMKKREATEQMLELARSFSEQSIMTAARLLTHKNPFVKLAAAKLLLERAHGKPIQPITNDGAPLVALSFTGPAVTLEQAEEVYRRMIADPTFMGPSLVAEVPAPVAEDID